MNFSGHGSHHGFPIGTVLAIFDVQVTLMPPSKFQVNLPFGSGEEAKIYFQDGGPDGHFGFPMVIIFSYFLSSSHPDASYKVSSQLVFLFRRRSEK